MNDQMINNDRIRSSQMRGFFSNLRMLYQATQTEIKEGTIAFMLPPLVKWF